MNKKMIEEQEVAKKAAAAVRRLGDQRAARNAGRGIQIINADDHQINRASAVRTQTTPAPRRVPPTAQARTVGAPSSNVVNALPAQSRPAEKGSLLTRNQCKRPRTEAGSSSGAGTSSRTGLLGFYDISNEKEMGEVLNKLGSLLLSDFMEINVNDRRASRTNATVVDHDWRVYKDSSVLLESNGNTTLELFNHILLPKDKLAVLKHSHPWVEKQAALQLSKLALCIHQLAITCSNYKNNTSVSEKELIDYKAQIAVELQVIQKDRKKLSSLQFEFDTICKNLDNNRVKFATLQGTINDLRLENIELKRKFQEMQPRVNEEKKMAYEKGQKDFLSSPQFTIMVREARIGGVRDFLRSVQFDEILISRALSDQQDGFLKALDYLRQLGGLDAKIDVANFEQEYISKPLVHPSLSPDNIAELANFLELDSLVQPSAIDINEAGASVAFQLELDAIVGHRNEAGEGDSSQPNP